nr:MAG: replication associated protein [Cressdnaviricota sp.]
MSRNRSYVFTLNNYSDKDYSQICLLTPKYLIVGKEIAPTTGTPHLQGYIYLENAKSLSAIKSIFPPATHFIAAKANATKNQAYCSKEGEFFEYGTPPNPGKRSDIKAIKELVKQPGTTVRTLFDAATSYQSLKMGMIGLSLYSNKSLRDIKVYWFHGKSGTGKTHEVYTTTDQEKTYWHSTAKWFQGYDAQEIAVFDDFRKDWFSFPYLLRLLDKYPMTVENKGGSTQWTPLTIYITAPESPEEMYKNSDENLSQLTRRITLIRSF